MLTSVIIEVEHVEERLDLRRQVVVAVGSKQAGRGIKQESGIKQPANRQSMSQAAYHESCVLSKRAVCSGEAYGSAVQLR